MEEQAKQGLGLTPLAVGVFGGRQAANRLQSFAQGLALDVGNDLGQAFFMELGKPDPYVIVVEAFAPLAFGTGKEKIDEASPVIEMAASAAGGPGRSLQR